MFKKVIWPSNNERVCQYTFSDELSFCIDMNDNTKEQNEKYFKNMDR